MRGTEIRRIFICLLLSFSLFNTSYSQVNLTSGLVAYYPFNGNANDASGNGNNGTPMNGVQLTTDRFGNPNSAYLFDGVDDYISVASSASLSPQNAMSIALYFNPSRSGTQVMLGKVAYTGTTATQYQLAMDVAANPGVKFGVNAVSNGCAGTATNTGNVSTNAPVSTNTWHCVVGTFDNGVQKIYLDGILMQTINTGFTTLNACSNATVQIGKWWSLDPFQFMGKIDDIRIYDRAINQDEINALCTSSCDDWLYTPSLGSKVTIGDLDVSGNQLTVEAVFNRTQPLNNGVYYGNLVSKHTDQNNVNYALLPNGCEITTTNGYKSTFQTCELDLNKTYHVAMVYDGAFLKYYRNGFLISQVACTGNIVNNNLATTIGQLAGGGNPVNNQFLGNINEVRIWNVARSQANIQAYMNSSLPGPTTQAGLLGYYTFDDLVNKQGNAAWNGSLAGAAAINQINPQCSFVADSCGVPPPVIADFDIPDTVCVNEPVNITNTSQGATSYYWNFCQADINQPPTGTNLGNIGGQLNTPVFMDYVFENNNYYGFLTNYNGGTLVRLDFGNSLLNTPTAVNLGNFGGIIPTLAEGIQVVKNEGKWYAIIVAGYTPGGSTPRILKVDFGANITNPSPIATNWGNIGNLSQPVDLHVFEENGHWYGFTVNAENNTITRFDFTTSFDNTPTAVNLGNLGGLAYPTGIYAINDNGFWRVFITNAGNNTRTSGVFSLTRLDFGNSLLNTPTAVNLGNPANMLKHPRDLTIMKFCGEIVGFAVNGLIGSNDIVKIDFHNDLTSAPTITSLGNIGNLNFPHSIAKIFRVDADLYSFITNVGNNTLTRLKFTGCTNSSVPNSALQNPPPVTYSAPGIYNINLVIDDGLATQTSVCKQIVVENCEDSVIINDYTEAVGLDVCKNILTVADASAFNVGDTILLIQMKGAVIDSTNTSNFGNITDYRNAGNYEFNYVKSKNGNDIELLNVLQKTYDFPDGKVQLIRVPYFEDYTVTRKLTCLPWNGSKGGVLAFNVQNSLTLTKDIDVSGRGFRGGVAVTHPVFVCNIDSFYVVNNDGMRAARKGEGIYETLRLSGRGKLANGGGGGNSTNAGGAGGGNGGAGGSGGKQYLGCGSTNFINGGIGGLGLIYSNALNKIFLGGGGGAGHENDTPKLAPGGNGGGIVIISSNTINANAYSILANGGTPVHLTGTNDDGRSGGGAGGTILLNYSNISGNLSVSVKGGDGDYCTPVQPEQHGPGGGGGGGIIWINKVATDPNITTSLAGGINGVNTNLGNDSWGAMPGQNGYSLFDLQLPVDNIPFKPNIDSVRINKTDVSCKAFDFEGLGYTNTYPVASWNWDFGDNSFANTQNTNHEYSASGNYTVKLVATDINGCKDSMMIDVTATALEHDFITEADVCNPYIIQITGTGPGIGGSNICDIDFGDGNSVTAVCNPTHTYTTAGDYTIHYILSNGVCRDTVTKIVSVGVSPDDIIRTTDTTICFGGTKQLLTVSSLDFCWTPTTYLDNPLSPNPVTSTPENITYYFNAKITGSNLITNGDFSQGNTGFTSQYAYTPPPNLTEGQYFVGVNPQAWNGGLSACGDHTTGNGNMMMVNGSPIADVNVWKQTVTVASNTNYAFSVWIQALWTPNPAQLDFSINGQPVGAVITASLPTCTWTQFYTTWNSGSNTTAVISIVNKNTQVQGNDFALDDISFAPVSIKQDSVVITVDKPFVQANADTTVCAGSPVQLNAAGAVNYTWSPSTNLSDAGIANPIATPGAGTSTEYIVTGINSNGCAAKDTVSVNTFPAASIAVTEDTVICNNATVQLSASGGVVYSWTPGSTLNDPSVSSPIASPVAPTTYYVTITDNNNCNYVDSVKVSFRSAPVFTVSSPDGTCLNDSLQLNASGGNVYSWQPAIGLSNPNVANPKASPANTTDYTVTITETACNLSDVLSTTVTVFPLPDIQASKSNDIDCSNDQSQLNATGGSSYVWSPGFSLNNANIANPIATPATTTEYVVKGTDGMGCINYDTVVVNADSANKGGYLMPNAFTPNGDGLNDCYGIRYWGVIQELDFNIYNRWGERIFHTSNPSQCWDGTYKGVKQNSDVFVYWIRAKTSCDNEVFRKGTFVLIR